METNFLKLYLEANKTLAKTLVIKSQVSIDSINDLLKLKYGTSAVDPYDPTSWKYYLNISGQYHSTDTMMMITSLDTLEDIAFTKENLQIHTTTKKEYLYGSRYYYQLVERYPEQEQLIISILYPADMQKAIAAEDGSILTYPSYLVEPQELTLLDELESFIKHQLIRWNVKAFAMSDTLYNVAQHALLYLAIVPKLLNLRVKRCHTNEVHSFHVREYLASHNRLDRYLPYLTLKQALWLYRNIRYIERNSGKVEQFKTLVDKLLTDRRVPLNEFSIRQLATFDDEYYNNVNIRRKAVNPQYNIPEKDYFDLDQLYSKERPLVYNNANYQDVELPRITHLLKTANSSVMQSKDLESAMVDYSDSLPDTLEKVLLREWAHLTAKGLYQPVLNIKDPKTLQHRLIGAKDAFIYFLYISMEAIGIHLTTIPTFINLKQRKLVLPSVNNLMGYVEDDGTLRSVAQELLSQQPAINYIYSVDSFFNLCYVLQQTNIYQWYLLSNTHDLYRRGHIANLITHFYEDEWLILEDTSITMGDWLASKNLPVYDYDNTQANEMLKEIFTKATGLTVDNSKILKNIQRALIEILAQLSSYSVQFITEINQSRIIPLGWAAIRVGHLVGQGRQNSYIDSGITVVDSKGHAETSYQIEAQLNKHFDNIVYRESTDIPVDIKSTFLHFQGVIHAIDVDFKSCITAGSTGAEDLGYNSYNNLTEQQKHILSTLYL